MKNDPFFIFDLLWFLLTLFMVLVTGSVVMLGFALVMAGVVALDLRRLIPKPKETIPDDKEE